MRAGHATGEESKGAQTQVMQWPSKMKQEAIENKTKWKIRPWTQGTANETRTEMFYSLKILNL